MCFLSSSSFSVSHISRSRSALYIFSVLFPLYLVLLCQPRPSMSNLFSVQSLFFVYFTSFVPFLFPLLPFSSLALRYTYIYLVLYLPLFLSPTLYLPKRVSDIPLEKFSRWRAVKPATTSRKFISKNEIYYKNEYNIGKFCWFWWLCFSYVRLLKHSPPNRPNNRFDRVQHELIQWELESIFRK